MKNIDLVEQKQFIIQKLDWVLQSVFIVNSPVAGTSGTSLSVDKIGYSSNPIVIDLVGGVLRISEGGGAAVALTPITLTISNLNFTHTMNANGPSETRIRVTATISNSATSTTIDYTKIIK
jgi:FlaG/FlaF family flagellin (archaellin)